jgi:hypothetical protein
MQRKRLMLILCFTLLFLSVSAQAEDIDGFRGMNWGDPLPKEGMTFFKKDSTTYGGMDFYKRDGDVMKIGGAKLDIIMYGYWNDKLSDVIIICSGYNNYSSLLLALKNKFGNPRQPNKYKETYLWSDNSKARIALLYDSIDKKTSVYMASTSITSEQYEWEKEQAKKGKNDF